MAEFFRLEPKDVINLWKKNSKSRENFKGLYFNQVDITQPGDDGFIKIVPHGYFPNHPNGAHEVKPNMTKEMVKNFDDRGVQLLFDYDHDSLWYGKTIAAAWSPQLEARKDGLYCKYPDFTPKASEMIANKEYRYLSPVYRTTTKDKYGKEIGATIHSVALTNDPIMGNEIDHIKNTNSQEDRIMLSKEALAKLGLTEDATEEQIEEAINAANIVEETQDPEPDASAGSATETEGADVINSALQNLTKTVNGLVERFNKQDANQLQANAEALVNSAISQFKILPRDKEVYLNSALQDYNKTKDLLDKIAVNSVKPGTVEVGGKSAQPAQITIANAQQEAANFFKAQGRTPVYGQPQQN